MAGKLPAGALRDVQICGVISVLWFLLYWLVRKVCRKYSAAFANRVVSLIHAFVGLIWPLLVIDFHHLRDAIGGPTTPAQLAMLRVSFAYFFYDMVCSLTIKFDFADVFHHVATLLGLYYGVFVKVSAQELLVALALMEASNPFMHMRFLLREAGKGKSDLAGLNDLLFALTFLVCRGILGPIVVYWQLLSPRPPLIVKFGGTAIQAVSLFWMGKILNVIAKKVSGKSGAKSD